MYYKALKKRPECELYAPHKCENNCTKNLARPVKKPNVKINAQKNLARPVKKPKESVSYVVKTKLPKW